MRKSITILFVTILSLFLLCAAVLAGGEPFSPFGGTLADSPDFESAKSFEADIRSQVDSLSSGGEAMGEIPYDKAVQVFITEDLRSFGDIESAKTGGEYVWRIPVVSGDQRIVSSLRAVKGKLTGCSSEAGTYESMKREAYLFDPSLIENTLDASGADRGDYMVCTVPSVQVDYISFNAEGKTRVIPFASRPDFWGLENGRAYDLEEFIKEVNTLISDSGPLYGGGSGAGGDISPIWYVLCAAAAAAIAAAVIIVLRKRSAAKR